MENPRYVKLTTIRNGHSYWKDTLTGEMLVADQSIRKANDPTTTDDGRMVVDEAMIKLDEGLVCHGEGEFRLYFRVPLRKPAWEGPPRLLSGYATTADIVEARWLALQLRCKLYLKVPGYTFELFEVEEES